MDSFELFVHQIVNFTSKTSKSFNGNSSGFNFEILRIFKNFGTEE
jgi:hypothetical protein